MRLTLVGKRNALRVKVALSEFGDFHLLNEYLGHFGNLPQEVGAGVRRTSREQTACSSTPSAVVSVTENSRPLKRRRSELLEESEHSTVTPDNTGIFTQVTLTTASPDRAQNSLGNAAMAYPYHQTIKTSGSISTDRQHQEHEKRNACEQSGSIKAPVGCTCRVGKRD
ncbi:hypothetical protein M9X92_011504 [Pyricularia oryzae]|nr:hypothetical protein M9X92_011504 [Pyricularia oryzae]